MHLIPTIEFLKSKIVNCLVEFVVNEKIGKSQPRPVIPVDVADEEKESFTELQQIKEITVPDTFHCLPGNIIIVSAVAVKSISLVQFFVDALQHLFLREKRFARLGQIRFSRDNFQENADCEVDEGFDYVKFEPALSNQLRFETPIFMLLKQLFPG